MRNCESASDIGCDAWQRSSLTVRPTAAMKNSLTVALIAVLLLASVASIIACAHQAGTNSQTDKPARALATQHPPLIGEMKVLSQGSQSVIEEPFVAVCRDDLTYQALKKIDKALPQLDKEFFQTRLVIAAYLGTRSTAGYSIEITRKGDPNINFEDPNRTRFEVNEKSPAKDAMVAQMITSPFMIVSLGVNGASPLILSLGDTWRQKQQLYRIKSGNFSMGGGLSDLNEAFEPHGDWLTLRARNLVSFYISMRGTGGSRERFLSDFATGILTKDELTINKLTADFFVDGPNSGFKATGTFKERDGKLSLSFSSLRSMVSDGYSGGGMVEAELVPSSTKE
jgi:hypothetical protein